MNLFNDLHKGERGIGMVTALAVAFVVFALGAIWVATANHELDEVTFNRHRTEAINAAEAGVRRAMGELQNNNPTSGEWFSDSGVALVNGVRQEAKEKGVIWLGIDADAPACDPAVLAVDGEGLGEYVVRVERLDAAHIGLEYQIEAWGWGPDRFSRQAVMRKVALTIELKPLDTFAKALFAAKSLVGTNRKEIYGDVYAGESVTISNFTRIYPNDDPSEPGIGSLEVYGDLTLTGGTKAEFGGPVAVQGGVSDQAVGTSYSDVRIGADTFVVGPVSYFRDATVNELRTAGTVDPTSKLVGPIVEGALVDPVLRIPLPVFDTDDLKTPLVVTWYTGGTGPVNIAAFQAYFTANKTKLSGIHIVDLRGTPMSVDFQSAVFAGHFGLIAQDGNLSMRGFASGVTATAPSPVSAAIVLDDKQVGRGRMYKSVEEKEKALGPGSLFTLAMQTGFSSVPGVLHHLVVSEGLYGAAQQSTIYGSVYGYRDVSSNRMEVHFRAPDDSILSGFQFVIPDSTRFIARPILWRELTVDEGTPLPAACP